MNTNRFTLFLVFFMLLSPQVYSTENRIVGSDEVTGTAHAVVVDDKVLAHTTQLLPLDKDGKIAATDVSGQVKQVVANLEVVLAEVGSSVEEIARLNVYVAKNELADEVRQALARELFKKVTPAVTLVVTALADSKALVAMDAIAAVPGSDAAVVELASSDKLGGEYGTAHVSLLPRGRVVYISGMAERAEELGAATTGTMGQLHGVLKLLGLEAEHVVHVKVFMKPMADVAESRAAIQAVYAGQMCPPISFVEWTNGLPAEIEMVAYLPGDAEEGATVAHRWQPDEKRSPVYCRFAVVDSPVRIYVAGLMSRTVADAEGQVRDLFSQLENILDQSGSDLRQMAKATYYVADDGVSKALNVVRPEVYDPKRPPAASKASIAGTGDEERPIVVDMIAVPKE